MLMDPNDETVSAGDVYQFTVPVFGKNVVYDAPLKIMQQQLRFVTKGLTGEAMKAHCLNIIKETEDFFSTWADDSKVELFENFCGSLSSRFSFSLPLVVFHPSSFFSLFFLFRTDYSYGLSLLDWCCFPRPHQP
jgi:hypothetical protein